MLKPLTNKPLSSTVFLNGGSWFMVDYRHNTWVYSNTEIACVNKPKGYAINFKEEAPLEFEIKFNRILDVLCLGISGVAVPDSYYRDEPNIPGVVWFTTRTEAFSILEIYYDLINRSIPYVDKTFSIVIVDEPYLVVNSRERHTQLPGDVLAVVATCDVDFPQPELVGSAFIEDI